MHFDLYFAGKIKPTVVYTIGQRKEGKVEEIITNVHEKDVLLSLITTLSDEDEWIGQDGNGKFLFPI